MPANWGTPRQKRGSIIRPVAARAQHLDSLRVRLWLLRFSLHLLLLVKPCRHLRQCILAHVQILKDNFPRPLRCWGCTSLRSLPPFTFSSLGISFPIDVILVAWSRTPLLPPVIQHRRRQAHRRSGVDQDLHAPRHCRPTCCSRPRTSTFVGRFERPETVSWLQISGPTS